MAVFSFKVKNEECDGLALLRGRGYYIFRSSKQCFDTLG